MKALDAISAAIARATAWLVAILATIMLSALVLQVFSRYVLGSAFSWTEELAIILFAWVVLLTATIAIRDDDHVRLDAALGALPDPARRVWLRVIAVGILGFCILFAWSGVSYVDRTLGQVTAAMRLPIECLHLAVPVSGVIGALHAFVRVFIPVADRTEEAPA